jgi:hypothetical protein
MRLLHLLISVIFVLFYCPIVHPEEQSQATDIQKEWIHAIIPAENSEVISKKPEIKVEFSKPVVSQTLLVLLDATDITQLLTVTEKGFEYKPFMVLAAGTHNLSISATDKEGKQLQKSISFTTRHTGTFEEAYTNNEISAMYDQALSKPDNAQYVPDRKFEANLGSDTKIKEKAWEVTFKTNVRFLDMSLPVASPLKKGIDVANWLFTGSYTSDILKLKTSIGDVQVNETQYTVAGLARRGGVFNLEYDVFQINAFSVKSEQVFGLKGGTGIEGTTDDHILGVSGGVNLFDKKVMFKTIYVTGGEPGSSFGISTTSGTKKGDVLGFVLMSDLFENKMRTEFEADFSKFDPDTSDEFESRNDNAYRAKIGGSLGIYNYEALYERIGKDYEVIGNQGLQKDKQGVSIINGLNLGKHYFNVLLSRYNDNLKGDDLFPRIVNYVAGIDYSCNEITNLPIGINYQKSIQDSSREPSGTDPIDLNTDTVAGRINYTKDKLNLGFQAAYSLQSDKSPMDYDTTTITYTFTPSYVFLPNVSINSAFSLNQSKIHLTDLRTDTYTINMDVRTKFFNDGLTFDVGGTYNIMKVNDDSTDNRNLSTNFRLAYNIKDFLKGYVNPTIALRGTYTKFTDNVYPSSNRDEFVLFLVLATTIPFSF